MKIARKHAEYKLWNDTNYRLSLHSKASKQPYDHMELQAKPPSLKKVMCGQWQASKGLYDCSCQQVESVKRRNQDSSKKEVEGLHAIWV